MKIFLSILFILTFIGCGLLPKNVEFFQKRVKVVPEKSIKTIEKEKQAAYYIQNKVDNAYVEAIKHDVTNSVVNPLFDAKIVAPALSLSLGPPKTEWNDSSEILARALNYNLATLNKEIQNYRNEVRVLEGKKIEGTGKIQIGYFYYIGGLLLLGFIIWTVLKVLAVIYPPVQLGTSVIRMGGNLVKQGFSQVVSGVESFKNRVSEEIDDPTLRKKILQIIRDEQEKKQSPEIQKVIRDLTFK